jgi:uncharacterized protein
VGAVAQAHLLSPAAGRPRQVTEYAIDIFATANLFRTGHRIYVEISSMDMPTGTARFINVEYMPYRFCNSRTAVHRSYCDPSIRPRPCCRS